MKFKALIEFSGEGVDLNKDDIIEICGFIGKEKVVLIDKLNDEEIDLPRIPYEFVINFCEKLDD